MVPGGAVRFRDGDASIATCDGVRLTSSAPHTATCTVTPTNPGSLAVTAEYLGDERTNASTSSVLVTTVRPRLAITSAPRVTVTYGDRVTFTVRTEGMAPSLTSSRAWWQTGLPSGMSFRDNGDGTATISGIPRGLGWHTLTVDATNRADPPVSQLFAIQVKKRPVSRCGGYGWFELLFVCDWSR